MKNTAHWHPTNYCEPRLQPFNNIPAEWQFANVFFSFLVRVGVDSDQDQQVGGDSFQVLQGVRISLRAASLWLNVTTAPCHETLLLHFYVGVRQCQQV